ncbi:hypothetical protein SEA_VASUNZINGA_70 [Mycobacterium phage VasuNzinga]|uniref:DUF7736 domain-containing protein n=1 Tax=Mycobacterium phage VasuNzinga TaxID=2301620 RepID=A0A385UG25_9CAUD|nr:hypothetical protein SEA_VASUNZINGA_70 [Mycobacterium phage VasuNzinga]
MNPAPREFDIAVVLSVYYDILLCAFEDYRELLNYMTGHDVAIWEIPRARRLCADALEIQYPILTLPLMPEGFKNDHMHSGKFIRKATKDFGAPLLPVDPIDPGKFVPHGPFEGDAYMKAGS